MEQERRSGCRHAPSNKAALVRKLHSEHSCSVGTFQRNGLGLCTSTCLIDGRGVPEGAPVHVQRKSTDKIDPIRVCEHPLATLGLCSLSHACKLPPGSVSHSRLPTAAFRKRSIGSIQLCPL